MADNLDRIARLAPARSTPSRFDKTLVCLFHDIEENVDTQVPRDLCQKHLSQMLAAERVNGVKTTYNVLGRLWHEKAEEISGSDSHAIGFHSFDHSLRDQDQLRRCRKLDLQVKGYRPPQSILTEELTDSGLGYYNIEWLLSSTKSLGFKNCRLENGVVKIPVHLDDYPLHTTEMKYESWKRILFQLVETENFVAIGLHDCYAGHWIDRYHELLGELLVRAEFRTCDEIAGLAYLEGLPENNLR